jgi:hypothetical protein
MVSGKIVSGGDSNLGLQIGITIRTFVKVYRVPEVRQT